MDALTFYQFLLELLYIFLTDLDQDWRDNSAWTSQKNMLSASRSIIILQPWVALIEEYIPTGIPDLMEDI